MPTRTRKVTWLVGAALLFALVLIQPGDIMGDNGRTFSRCVQQCNESNRQCGDECSTDCFEIWPGTENKPARDACITDCKSGVCTDAKR